MSVTMNLYDIRKIRLPFEEKFRGIENTRTILLNCNERISCKSLTLKGKITNLCKKKKKKREKINHKEEKPRIEIR